MRLLLVEDDSMIGASVQKGLRQDGFVVDWVRDGHAAELAAANGVYSLILLDLGLPKKDGLDVLATLRKRGDATPVLVLTARDAITDRVKGLDSGADDYLVKPFDLDELAARIRALLRRQAGRAEPALHHGELAREVIAEHMLLATSKNIDLGVARSEAVAVSGDREGLRVMLGNLVDNAVRYTPNGGKIDVSVFSEAEGAVIEVVDNGPGIAPEDRVRVFDRFFRSAGQEIPGSGLGLAIVKNIAERHHARVILTDGPGGRGLAASVVFPRQ